VLEWTCGEEITACTVTDDIAGGIIATGGGSGNVNVSPLVTTPYTLNCNRGTFTDEATVRVLSINEVPPR
jgi:hypothetical protein